ncbi:MAG: sigma-54 dependent transcriptional regulator [Candidatus Eisenbacteria bacterium]
MVHSKSRSAVRSSILLIAPEDFYSPAVLARLRERADLHIEPDGQRAVADLATRAYDVVLLRLEAACIPDPLETLKRIREIDPLLPVILISCAGSTEMVLQAGRLGATDCVPRDAPADLLERRLASALEQVIADRRAEAAARDARATDWRFVGESDASRALLKDALTVAQVDSPVLITGEHGTGKEILARFIHRHSPRSGQPFVAINCAAIPENLFESELFGHEKGAFTGATSMHRGSFELAGSGTLLLDEITEIPYALQAKLLRTLQSGEYSRVGSERKQWAKARVICSTNRDPQKAAAERVLREDLFYRINVVHLHIPPLRDRREDIRLQAHHFLECKCRELGKRVSRLSAEAEALLLAHDWPGNSRELENLIERAVVFCETGEIGPELMSPISEGAAFLALPWEEAREIAMRRFERNYLTALLQVYSGSVSRASRAMGVSRQAFYKALERAELSAEPFRRTRHSAGRRIRGEESISG